MWTRRSLSLKSSLHSVCGMREKLELQCCLADSVNVWQFHSNCVITHPSCSSMSPPLVSILKPVSRLVNDLESWYSPSIWEYSTCSLLECCLSRQVELQYGYLSSKVTSQVHELSVAYQRFNVIDFYLFRYYVWWSPLPWAAEQSFARFTNLRVSFLSYWKRCKKVYFLKINTELNYFPLKILRLALPTLYSTNSISTVLSARLFEMFDQLYILGSGQCIYNGTVSGLVPFLNAHDLICPQFRGLS